MKYSFTLPIAWVTLRILIVVNWLAGAAIFALLIATIVAKDWTFAALGFTPASGIPTVIMGLRAVAALGIVAMFLNHAVLQRLVAIVVTVRRGDPFVAANAVAWALLALQLLSLVIGAIGEAISTATLPIRLDAGFSTSGWLAVILTFVLARVFAEGTLMRQDLEGTV